MERWAGWENKQRHQSNAERWSRRQQARRVGGWAVAERLRVQRHSVASLVLNEGTQARHRFCLWLSIVKTVLLTKQSHFRKLSSIVLTWEQKTKENQGSGISLSLQTSPPGLEQSSANIYWLQSQYSLKCQELKGTSNQMNKAEIHWPLKKLQKWSKLGWEYKD